MYVRGGDVGGDCGGEYIVDVFLSAGFSYLTIVEAVILAAYRAGTQWPAKLFWPGAHPAGRLVGRARLQAMQAPKATPPLAQPTGRAPRSRAIEANSLAGAG